MRRIRVHHDDGSAREPQSKFWKRVGGPVQDLDGGAPFQPAKTASTTSAEPEEPPGLARVKS